MEEGSYSLPSLAESTKAGQSTPPARVMPRTHSIVPSFGLLPAVPPEGCGDPRKWGVFGGRQNGLHGKPPSRALNADAPPPSLSRFDSARQLRPGFQRRRQRKAVCFTD
jgi:hypothetical protein